MSVGITGLLWAIDTAHQINEKLQEMVVQQDGRIKELIARNDKLSAELDAMTVSKT